MTFPQVAATAVSSDASGTTHTVNLPASITSGDLLLAFFAFDDAGADVIAGFPVDWTAIPNVSGAVGPSRTAGLEGYYRVADGSEGSTISVTTDSTEATRSVTYRITGYSGTPEGAGFSPPTSGNNSPNPPSLAPSWGASDTLWIAVCANDGSPTVTGIPTNYTDGLHSQSTNSGHCSVGTARREALTGTEDPGTFTISASEQWRAATVAIQPTAVVPVDTAEDRFTRSATNGWGTADVGGVWACSEGTLAAFSVNGSTGIISPTEPANVYSHELLAFSRTDTVVQYLWTCDQPPAGGFLHMRAFARYLDDLNHYRVAVELNHTTQVMRIRLETEIADVQTNLDAINLDSFIAGRKYWLKFSVSGTNPTTLSAKCWPVEEPEPGGWQVTDTDSDATLQVPGAVGLRVDISSGYSGANPEWGVDEFDAGSSVPAAFQEHLPIPYLGGGYYA